jgi:hypothetical protein
MPAIRTANPRKSLAWVAALQIIQNRSADNRTPKPIPDLETLGNGPENIYIQSARLNGQSFDRAWITYEQLTAGTTLEFEMAPHPNYGWGANPDALPPPLASST